MKKLLLILLFLPMIGFGQDTIILRNGESIQCEILAYDEIHRVVEYKKIDSDVIFSTPWPEISMIKYNNGKTKKFTKKSWFLENNNFRLLVPGALIMILVTIFLVGSG